MSRPDLFTYTGALRVLGKYERPWLEKFDLALGGAILAGGVIGGPAVLGLIDPKNEAMSSLRKVLDGVSARMTGLSGVHRQHLVSAAHTVIAVNSVFDAFRDLLGPAFDRLDITDREKFRMLGVEPAGKNEADVLPALAELNVPVPDATRGFQQNLDGPLTHFFSGTTAAVANFVSGLAVWPALSAGLGRGWPSELITASRERYVHHYLGLASAIPEFQVWTFIGEHSATRAAVEAGNARLAEALAAQTESLERFAGLLALSTPARPQPDRSYRGKLERAALATLAKPLLRTDPETHPVNAQFPSVERGFVAPRYRVAVHDEKAVPSSEEWWSSHAIEEDIDAFLAAHLSGPTSTTRPLLVLGHPGAGKSLLMEVLAARLPASGYTVVNVQLRKVNADDTVTAQIETALTDVLAEKVDWGRLADECGDSIRVVLLDGFDELVQASGVTQSNYIKQVRDFQDREAAVGRPVAVVITSRTLVVDRARIPHGVPIVKLEEFDDPRIGKWLDAWNHANTATPDFRPLAPDDLLRHGDLARQPLILLMLAIYAADAENSRLDDENLSQAELYERLIDSFVVRQARDKSRVEPSGAQVAKRVKQGKWQLGIAALAMFNRGRQYVEATELERDLKPFTPSPEVVQRSTFDDPLTLADRTVGDFFFIHSAQLNERDGKADRRTYEFLHATFGEYLIAEVTLSLLRTVLADKERRDSRPFEDFGLLDDALLYALISHQAFTKRRPILDFASGLFRALDEDVQIGLLDVLDQLIDSVHQRVKHDQHPAYDPSGATLVSRVAAYSANLVCLRVVLAGRPVPLESLFRIPSDWRSTVHLWNSGLDLDGWQSLSLTLTLDWENGSAHIVTHDSADDPHVREAQLVGDPVLEGMVRAGRDYVGPDITPATREQQLLERLSSWIGATTGLTGLRTVLPYDLRQLGKIIAELEDGVALNTHGQWRLLTALSRDAWRLPEDLVGRAVAHFLRVMSSGDLSTEMCSVICAHPRLLDELDGDRIRDWITHDSRTAPAKLVLLWRTGSAIGIGRDKLDWLMREVDSTVRQASRGPWSPVYLPVDFFEYLTSAEAENWVFDQALLSRLRDASEFALGKVEPRHFAGVVEKFREGTAPEEGILAFVRDYLSAHEGEGSFPDLASALAALERMG
ncbi:NACHT domain-containing protein [Saccharothrix saharensis]|uniref:NACHT domain-containing protein n=1 Tax=Saccharothrix saharensis TaxID=571190 RepID=UPI0036BC4CC4